MKECCSDSESSCASAGWDKALFKTGTGSQTRFLFDALTLFPCLFFLTVSHKIAYLTLHFRLLLNIGLITFNKKIIWWHIYVLQVMKIRFLLLEDCNFWPAFPKAYIYGLFQIRFVALTLLSVCIKKQTECSKLALYKTWLGQSATTSSVRAAWHISKHSKFFYSSAIWSVNL